MYCNGLLRNKDVRAVQLSERRCSRVKRLAFGSYKEEGHDRI